MIGARAKYFLVSLGSLGKEKLTFIKAQGSSQGFHEAYSCIRLKLTGGILAI